MILKPTPRHRKFLGFRFYWVGYELRGVSFKPWDAPFKIDIWKKGKGWLPR